MMLCSHLRPARCHWKHELSRKYKAIDCPRTNYQNGVHTATRCPLLWGTVTVPEFYRGYLKKKCVFTLMPGAYRTRAPCPDTRCARCPSYFLKSTNDLSIKARLLSPQISPFNWTKSYNQKRRPKFPKLF